ncbi:hypothetical protein BDB01DRAFT_847081 [Pilobolus umbonatus]|nr:hypothetical protein BDB01DRAFT_847081 [Pilobolus umbonatus]
MSEEATEFGIPKEVPLKRRKSDSNLLPLKQNMPTLARVNVSTNLIPSNRRRTSQLSQVNKSISLAIAEKQIARQQYNMLMDNNPQEDTFYRALEIHIHHSVGSMSISPASRDVVLAGRQGLVVIDLENPWLLPRILPLMSKWEVADVQWSPHIARESWVASTSNQKLLVWNLNYSGAQAVEHVFHAHSRAISDINWSPHQPDILATCSVDTYVHLWDLREPQISFKDNDDRKMRPSSSFTPWNAAATQVKFNRKSEYLIASAHDKDVKIWDIRKGAVPVTSITAHSKKIYGIDWSRQNDHDIVTCSLDKLVKFWNINTPEKEEEVIVTDTPIWRARNTPFGNGVLIMPQRTDSKLTLYNIANAETPIHAFEGHVDTVKEFVWRWKGDANGSNGDDREFQLVTWSKDQNLRLWPVSENILKLVDHHPSAIKTKLSAPAMALENNNTTNPHSFQREPLEKPLSGVRSGFPTSSSMRLTQNSNSSTMSPYKSGLPSSGGYEQNNAFREHRYSGNPLLWMQNVKTVGPPGELIRDATAENSYQSVAEEMSTVLNKYSNIVKTEKVNAASRTCTISLHGPWSDTGDALLRVTIRFSSQYPDNSPPEFDIQKNSMISIYYRAHMTQDLNALSSNYTSQKKWCLEPCIRYLLGENMQEESECGLDNMNTSIDSSTGLISQTLNTGFGTTLGAPGHWKGATTVDVGDSDDELGQGWGAMGDGFRFGKRESLTSERGIMVDMSAKQSTDEKVPFPRLCGGVFSGNGQLVCFFSTLRVRDSNRSTNNSNRNDINQDNRSQSDRSNGEYFENTYSDFYRHPRTYEQFEEYKEIAAMSRQGKNATVLVGGTGRAFGDYVYDDDQDDMDDGLSNVNAMPSLYFKAENITLNSPVGNGDNILYHGSKQDRTTHNVTIVDFSYRMPYSPWLAKEYILSLEDPVASCLHNAQVCRKHGRLDLYKVWSLAVEILRECVPNDLPELDRFITDKQQAMMDTKDKKNFNEYTRDKRISLIKNMLFNNTSDQTQKEIGESLAAVTKPMQRVKWGMHPLGQKLVDDLLQHFTNIGDIQTAAMLCCIFQFKSDKRSSTVHNPKSVQFDKTPEVADMDYFSLKSIHRSQSSQNGLRLQLNSDGNLEKAQLTQLSSSYGSKSGLLSHLWEGDKKTGDKNGPLDKLTEIANELPPSKRNSRLNRSWTMNHPKLKIPSNTAPGLRQTMGGSFGSFSSVLSSPLITTPTTSLFNREGKVLTDTTELKLVYTNLEHFDGEKFFHYNNIPIMDSKGIAQRDVLCISYADMLYRWNLLDQRAEILKFLNHPLFPDKEIVSQHIQVPCYVCGQEILNPDRYCLNCRKVRRLIRCSYCHILVKGLINFCTHCGHGGHSEHMKEWFLTNQQLYCMTGCGCKCALESLDTSIYNS